MKRAVVDEVMILTPYLIVAGALNAVVCSVALVILLLARKALTRPCHSCKMVTPTERRPSL